MSISSIMIAGTSGITAAQTQIRVASDNIANINTPGYARKVANQESVVVAGVGLGARIASITRVADQFLQKASLSANAQSGLTGVSADYMDKAQSLFGDPSGATSFFSSLDSIYSAFSTAAENPSSSLGRNSAITAINDFLDQANTISGGLHSLAAEADQTITAKVSRVNEILQQLAQTNTDISRSSVMGGDASGSENIQAKLLDELSGLMSIQVSGRTSGGVNVRSEDGVLLAGDGGASTLDYDTSQGVGVITAAPPHGQPQTIKAGGGEIDGLLQMSRTELPRLSEQLSEFVTHSVDELNRAHNASSSIPAPGTLTGRNTGLDMDTAVSGFTGKTRIAMVDASGLVTKTVDIDFSAKQISENGAGAVSYAGPPVDFLAGLKAAMQPEGDASFANGALSLTAATGGLVISDDPATPASKIGKGFSHFFGLNDLITSPNPSDYDTGLKGADPNGFLPGEALKLQLTDSSGNLIKAVNITIPPLPAAPAPPPTMDDLLATLNSGVGLYGQFSLDSRGHMSFAAAANQDVQISVASDDTHRGVNGPSISQLFGIGSDAKASRTTNFAIRSDISLNYNRMAFAQFDRTATGTTPALAVGDGAGALALAMAGSKVANFGAAGDMRSVQMSVLSYASELSGQIGSKAAAAKDRKDSADAVSQEATTRRSSVEGVNLDEELINLTTFQQAYNASARLISAAKDMYDVLLGMVQ